MKRQLAHAMRRTARRLIGWSNRLDRPRVEGLAARSISFESQQAGTAVDGLLEALVHHGTFPSKGAARRAMGLPDSALLPTPGWPEGIARGIAGARPKMP